MAGWGENGYGTAVPRSGETPGQARQLHHASGAAAARSAGEGAPRTAGTGRPTRSHTARKGRG